MNGTTPNGAAGTRTLLHMQDITSAPVNLDINMSLHKILDIGQTSMRHAISLAFNRPDNALEEFIRASVAAIEIAPRHRDFPVLNQKERLYRVYKRLIQDIKTNQDSFEAIKADIVADNERTGVKPRSSMAKNPPIKSALPSSEQHSKPHSRSQSESQTQRAPGRPHDHDAGNSPIIVASPQKKKKPPIHPKPAGLRVRFAPTSSADSNPPQAQDNLVARFQNLRPPSSPVVQDPRIKTYPIVIPAETPKPAIRVKPKPEGALSPGKENANGSFEPIGSVPSLPKVPAAIYNPARGTLSSQASNLPSSTPRGMFSRANSTTSVSGCQPVSISTPPTSTPINDDYFALSHSLGTPRAKESLPDGDTISVLQLRRYGNLGAANFQILIIDVRERQAFDEGHIMSHATICIEPLTLSEDMSSDEVGDRMVLGSNTEVQLFERRDKFDLVLLYDEKSKKFPSHRGEGNHALRYLRDALVLFEDDRPLQADPKLLEGGLEAWVDVMGPYSLQSTSSRTRRGRNPSSNRPPTLVLDEYSHKVVHLPDKDIRKWQDLLDEEENKPESPFTPIRTTDDFLRRFPDVDSLQESMTSTERPAAHVDTVALDAMFPPVPSRPAPAVPRPNYTGLADDGLDAAHQPGTLSVKMLRTRLEPNTVPTNLSNEGATCYADSALQLIVASTDLAKYLTSGRWMDIEVIVKNQDGQPKKHAQILTRILAGLFQHLQSGVVRSGVRATILRRYMGDLVKHADIPNFGDPHQQQDIAEYFHFLMGYLDDETNPRRNEAKTFENLRGNSNEEPPFQFAARWFVQYVRSHNSLVDAYVRFTTTESKTCRCGHVDTTTGTCLTEPGILLNLSWPDGQHDKRLPLEALIAQAIYSDQMVSCESCHSHKQVLKRFSSLPKYLFMAFTRYRYYQGEQVKHHTPIDFPVSTDLDMTPFMWPDEIQSGTELPQMQGPFNYELYGMAIHNGFNAHSGHYTAYTRKQSPDWREWWYLNDTSIRGAEDFKLKGDSNTRRQYLVDQFSQNVGDVTMLCYRRTLRDPQQKQMSQI